MSGLDHHFVSMFYLQQKQEEEQTACLHIKWNSCACVLATMYKQEIFVQIPHKYHPISSEIQTDEQTQYKALKNFTKFEERFFFFFFKLVCSKVGGERTIRKQFHISVSFVVFILRSSILRTVGDYITLPASLEKTAALIPTDLLESD